jgi:type II secretory ATPase GspE/PulE/Tfp pilus assembly ATPase PilB-like protein
MADELQLDDLLSLKNSHNNTNETAAKLQTKLSAIKAKHDEAEVKKRAEDHNLNYINLTNFPISLASVSLIEEKEARANQIVCFYYDGANIKIGHVDYENANAKNTATDLAKKKNCQLELFLISQASFEATLELYQRLPKTLAVDSVINIKPEELTKYKDLNSFEKIKNQIARANTSEMITMMVAAAINTNASDIHIEAEKDQVVFRFRIDGVLYVVATTSKDRWPQIIARIKLLAGLKLNIEDAPQDGRVSINLSGKSFEMRVSTIPTGYGESAVLRLLRPTTVSLDFELLGLRGQTKTNLEKEMAKPNGLILNAGPTGSGKTTTLYSILSKLNNPTIKIITLEDPIEYKLAGINQSQIDHSRNYSFATGLRSSLRQDPDIIMVGEIRDLETAEVSINAALTGHLVLSTVHTNSAAAAVFRLLSMGVKPYLLAPALNIIISQRLVRRLCDKCKKEHVLSKEDKEKTTIQLNKIPTIAQEKLTEQQIKTLKFYQAVGCPACNNLGYQGRLAIYETLLVTPAIEKLILSNNISSIDIEEASIANGMVTMLQDGLLKATDGLTSVSEVYSAIN